jgi:hypothetical protein
LLVRAGKLAPGLFWRFLETACPRSAALGATTAAAAIRRLAEAGAWTDAAFALVRLELPLWSVRRLIYDDGGWRCTMSRQPHLPDWLDDAVEGHHPNLAIAILLALMAARQSTQAPETPALDAHNDRSARSLSICCDNFS